jgi:hypothetical protein
MGHKQHLMGHRPTTFLPSPFDSNQALLTQARNLLITLCPNIQAAKPLKELRKPRRLVTDVTNHVEVGT